MKEKRHMLQEILQSKVEHFVFDFTNYSKTMFLDNEGNLMLLTDGEVPIDDSASERALRNFTIGRKNVSR